MFILMAQQIELTITDFVTIVTKRRENKFDTRIAFGGDTGDGKSTCCAKILFRFDGFDPWKHQVYNRDDVINLLQTQRSGICWDDEAIKSGYKRKFQDTSQHDLIEILTAYRDNFNMYCAIMPDFFNFDKNIRDLFAFFIQIVERGIAVVHRPIKGMVFNQDKWDAQNNAKIERSWMERRKKNPDFKPPYHELSTFAGYLYFNDITPKQRELIEEVKRTKRGISFGENKEPDQKSFNDKVYDLLLQGKLKKSGLQQICLLEGKKYSSVSAILSRRLVDSGEGYTLKHYFDLAENEEERQARSDIQAIVPDV